MFSTRKNFGSAKNSERESGRKNLTLNLEVCGSPAPIYSQQPKILRECKIYKHVPKESKRNNFSFPVDKIIYLTQKLELTSLTAKKVKSVSLSALDIAANKCSEEVEKVVSCSQGCEKKPNKRSTAVFPSDFDFSLDLSSIVNTADESDENCVELGEEEGQASFHYINETSNSRPTRKELLENNRVSRFTDQTSPETNKVQDFLLRDQRGKSKSSSCDLINVYINSVNNQQDLIKYFRPCYICKEPCCICPVSPSTKNLCPVGNAIAYYMKNARDQPCGFDKTNKKDGTVVDDTGFVGDCTNCPFLRKKLCRSEFCCREILEADSCTPFSGEEFSFRNDPVSQRAKDNSICSDRIYACTSSLANAARSARVLARDLELILSSLNSDTE